MATSATAMSVSDAYREREAVVRGFFAENADRLAELCHLMARRFARGGRLLAFGTGAAVTDAQHISVEFVHPVIVGKRALPALALPNDIASTVSLAARSPDGYLAQLLGTGGGPEDIAFGMVHTSSEPGGRAVATALDRAAALGMLTVALGDDAGAPVDGAHGFAVPSADPFVVQEVHETLYHVLWELVHVFFEHKGLLDDRRAPHAHDSGQAGFLYPFLAEAERDVDTVLGDVQASILRKAEDVIELRRTSCDPDALLETARLIAERIDAGGKVIALGNGGSATDAQDLVSDLVAPPEGMAPVPALSLTNDTAVITAVANDVGFENVFARQVIAHGRSDDVLVAISTSGGSRNVLAAVDEARRRGLLTVGLSGYGGGDQAERCERSHTVDAEYVPRIQEAQATQYHLLRSILAAGAR